MKSPANIVCILGSPHRNGNSSTLAEYFCRAAVKKDAKTRIFFLNELKYRGCQGCLACKTGLDHCVQEDELQVVLEAINKADILVLATPVYLGDISGQLKLFIDRTFSFVSPKYRDIPPASRLTGGRKLVFIQTQSQLSETRFADIFEKYRRIFHGIGFDASYLIRACGVSLPHEAGSRPDLQALAENTAKQVLEDAKNRTRLIRNEHVDYMRMMGYASGGHISGIGDRDSVPAMLTPGEYVIRKSIVSKLGRGFFDTLNAGSRSLPVGRHGLSSIRLPQLPMQKFASGGPVEPSQTITLDFRLGGQSHQGVFAPDVAAELISSLKQASMVTA